MLNINKVVFENVRNGLNVFFHLNVVPQAKMITVLLKVLPYLCVMDKRGEMLCERKVRERHHLFGNIGSIMRGEYMTTHYKTTIYSFILLKYFTG